MISPGEALEFLYKEIKTQKQVLAFYEIQGLTSGPLVENAKEAISKYEQLAEWFLKEVGK